MLLWLIILSLITSAKSVNLTLSPSLSARIVTLVTLLTLMWAVIISPMPLVITIVICGYLLSHKISLWTVSPLQGQVTICFDQFLIADGNRATLQSMSELHSFAFIAFKTQGKRWLLWRDSCDDTTYRQLLVRLKHKV